MADELHFRRAAQRLGVSQPALSSQLRVLEQLLGIQIFERGSRRVMVTKPGQEVVRRARQVLRETDELVSLARASAAPLTGALQLGVIPTIAPYLLPRVLPAVRAAHPELELFLQEDHTERIVAMLADGRLDACLLALGVQGTERDGLTALPVFDEPFWLAAPSGHRLAAKPQVSEDDLSGEQVLLLEDGH